jgi:predicted exporter
MSILLITLLPIVFLFTRFRKHKTFQAWWDSEGVVIGIVAAVVAVFLLFDAVHSF